MFLLFSQYFIWTKGYKGGYSELYMGLENFDNEDFKLYDFQKLDNLLYSESAKISCLDTTNFLKMVVVLMEQKRFETLYDLDWNRYCFTSLKYIS